MINLKIKIFADGANLDDIFQLNDNNLIKGFTTNPSLMKKSNISNYKEFADAILSTVKTKPISFEVLSDDLNEMYLDFLNDFSEMKFPPQFFVNNPSYKVIEKLQTQDLIKNYWISDSEEDAKLFLIRTDVSGHWFNCLSKTLSNSDLMEVINTMEQIKNLSPGIIASAFHESLKGKKITSNIKKIIALSFYYEQSLMLLMNSEE